MRRNPDDGADPHINPNVGGESDGRFGLFGNWFGFLRNFWYRNAQTEQSSDPSIVRIMQNQAIESNNSHAFLNLMNIYSLGDEKNGVKPKGSKAL